MSASFHPASPEVAISGYAVGPWLRKRKHIKLLTFVVDKASSKFIILVGTPLARQQVHAFLLAVPHTRARPHLVASQTDTHLLWPLASASFVQPRSRRGSGTSQLCLMLFRGLKVLNSVSSSKMPPVL